MEGMKTMKKDTRKTARIGMLLLVLCLISTAMLSGTFAKYTSEYAGADTALVARWQFEVFEGTTALGAPDDDPIQALDLFKHEYDTHINQIDGVDYIIAPGVNDDFSIKMKFLSDVDAKVTVDFAEGASTAADGLPIEYLVVDTAGADEADWVSLADLNEAFVSQLVANNSGVLADAAVAADPADGWTFTFEKSGVDDAAATEITQQVRWRWAFDGAEQTAEAHTLALASSDDTDTGFGTASASGGATRTSYILDVSVLAEQITPTLD